jgi:hypothetical protein
MKRLVYQLSSYNLTHFDLENARWQYFTQEEAKEMHRKRQDILGCMGHKNAESLAFAEKMFELGYIAAHINYPESENT